jgi:hypothetical protein
MLVVLLNGVELCKFLCHPLSDPGFPYATAAEDQVWRVQLSSVAFTRYSGSALAMR